MGALAAGLDSTQIWAPELHFLAGKWHLYYTATDAEHAGDATHYILVLKNANADPTTGTWVDKGRENRIIYHAKAAADGRCEGRSARAQRLGWRADGTPDFGVPAALHTPQLVPSGE